jgi:hypothetical protein
VADNRVTRDKGKMFKNAVSLHQHRIYHTMLIYRHLIFGLDEIFIQENLNIFMKTTKKVITFFAFFTRWYKYKIQQLDQEKLFFLHVRDKYYLGAHYFVR